jgi:hypothetical protein
MQLKDLPRGLAVPDGDRLTAERLIGPTEPASTITVYGPAPMASHTMPDSHFMQARGNEEFVVHIVGQLTDEVRKAGAKLYRDAVLDELKAAAVYTGPSVFTARLLEWIEAQR